MKIVADENIPLVAHFFGNLGEIILKPGREIKREDLIDADILLVRAVTRVDKDLLQGTRVQFVGSPVSGMDHIDTRWLDSQGIRWAEASGCNADAVVEYVVCVAAALQLKKKVGVIGCGTIGARVVKTLTKLGFEVTQCDPIRAEQEEDFKSVGLSDLGDLDWITLHVPLTYDNHPTFHMIEKNFLQRQKKGCVLINAARGSVIDQEDLKKYGEHLDWCLDVFENEPNIDLEILKKAVIATPHIAGYSVQSKIRGIEMIYEKAVAMHIIPKTDISPALYPRKKLPKADALMIFNPLEYSNEVKKALLSREKTFDELRKAFNNRYEFQFIQWVPEGRETL